MERYTFPATIARDPEDGRFWMASFRDVPGAHTGGRSREAVTARAGDCLATAIEACLEDGRAVPQPSRPRKGEVLIPLEPSLAAKAAVIEAFRVSGLTQTALAKRLGIDAREVRRLLDPTAPSKLGTLSNAAEALGIRLVITVRAAA